MSFLHIISRQHLPVLYDGNQMIDTLFYQNVPASVDIRRKNCCSLAENLTDVKWFFFAEIAQKGQGFAKSTSKDSCPYFLEDGPASLQ